MELAWKRQTLEDYTKGTLAYFLANSVMDTDDVLC